MTKNTIDLTDGTPIRKKTAQFFETDGKKFAEEMQEVADGADEQKYNDDQDAMRYKQIDREIFQLKIRKFFRKILHFPALLLDFIKKSLLGFVVKWLIIGGVGIAVFLHFTDTYSSLYYKIHISLERSKNERIEETVNRKLIELDRSSMKLDCYKNQFKRIADDQQVDISYCNEI